MDDFIVNFAKRFAKIIHSSVGKFQDLIPLKERFEKEIALYKNQSKDDFLNNLKVELGLLFDSHLISCKKIDCPQRLTFKNISFLILQELNQEKLSSFLIDNPNYDSHINYYHAKIKTTSAFLDKKQFIKQEIERIKTTFIKPSILTAISGGKIISQFNYSQYTKYAYDWLMAGQDWELSQILKSARNQYLQNHANVLNEQEFKDAIYGNLKGGVAFVLYEKFLNDELKSLEKIDLKNQKKKKRISIPVKTRALLQKEINSNCPFCNSGDVDHFEVHHIDEDCENNAMANLLMLCPTCHSKVTKGDISRELVISKKTSLKTLSG